MSSRLSRYKAKLRCLSRLARTGPHLLCPGGMTATADSHNEAETFLMVRTVCCESYKQHGRRCEICPHRPENRQAVLDYKASEAGRLHALAIFHPSAAGTMAAAFARIGSTGR